MKKRMCLLLALLLCFICLNTGLAAAIEVGGAVLRVPEGWSVEYDALEEGVRYVSLYKEADAMAKQVRLSARPLSNPAELEDVEKAQSYLSILALAALQADNLTDISAADEYFVTLRDGYHAWRATYPTQEGGAIGRVFLVGGGRSSNVFVYDPAGDEQQCAAILHEILGSLSAQDRLTMGDVSLGVPAGWQTEGEATQTDVMFTDAYGGYLRYQVMAVSQEEMQQLQSSLTEHETLELISLLSMADMNTTNLLEEKTELNGMPCVLYGADVTADSGTGATGTLALLNGNNVIFVSLLSGNMTAADALNLMRVVKLAGTDGVLFDYEGAPLMLPQGFSVLDTVKLENGVVTAWLTDREQPQVHADVYPLKDAAAYLGREHQFLLEEIEKRLDSEFFNNMYFRYEELGGGIFCLRGSVKYSLFGTPYAMSVAMLLHGSEMTMIRCYLPAGEMTDSDQLLSAILPQKEEGMVIDLGGASVLIPGGWDFTESMRADGEYVIYANNYFSQSAEIYWRNVPQLLKNMLAEYGVQTALEVHIALWAENAGYPGITVEYEMGANGVHTVRAGLLTGSDATGLGVAFDGEMLVEAVITCIGGTEEAALQLTQKVFSPMLNAQ